MWRGGGETTKRYGKTNHRQNPPAYRQRGGVGETKKGELKENTGAKTRETNIKTLPPLRKGVKFALTPAMEKLVREILAELATPPILVFPNWDAVADGSRPFHL